MGDLEALRSELQDIRGQQWHPSTAALISRNMMDRIIAALDAAAAGRAEAEAEKLIAEKSYQIR